MASIIFDMERIIVIKNDREAAGHPGQADLDDPSMIYESPERMTAALSAVEFFSQWREKAIPIFDAPAASRDQMLLAHTPDYLGRLDAAFDAAKHAESGIIDLRNEAIVSVASKAAILSAAGAGIDGVDKVLGDRAHHAFCIVRPPGHHAESDTAMGYCVASNAAIAALHAAKNWGIRVAIIDFDAHRGNGTESIVAGRDGILFCDLFLDGDGEYPYPKLHPIPELATNVVRVPLTPLTSGEQYVAEFRTKVLPRVTDFKPQLLIFSAGFDCLQNDPVGGFGLTPKHLHSVVRDLLAVCDRSVSVLEGGYHISHLGLGVLGHLIGLSDSKQQ